MAMITFSPQNSSGLVNEGLGFCLVFQTLILSLLLSFAALSPFPVPFAVLAVQLSLFLREVG